MFLKDSTSKPIVIDSKLTNTTPIGITMGEPGVFTSGWTEQMGVASPTKYFASDDPAYTASFDGEELTLAEGHGPQLSGGDMFRLYNPYSGEHFYTASAYERDVLVGLSWQDEDVGWVAPAEGVPVLRQYNPYASVGTHNYTTSAFEAKCLVDLGWRDEGTGWYAL